MGREQGFWGGDDPQANSAVGNTPNYEKYHGFWKLKAN